jgi:hypothetical protein
MTPSSFGESPSEVDRPEPRIESHDLAILTNLSMIVCLSLTFRHLKLQNRIATMSALKPVVGFCNERIAKNRRSEWQLQ